MARKQPDDYLYQGAEQLGLKLRIKVPRLDPPTYHLYLDAKCEDELAVLETPKELLAFYAGVAYGKGVLGEDGSS